MAEGGMNTQKSKAKNNRNLYQRANDHHRRRWQVNARKNRDYYNNDQLTEKDRKDLEDAGMPTFIVNRTTPVIEMMRYFATANSPMWQAQGRDASDSDLAHLHNAVSMYCWEQSDGQNLFGQIVQDALVEGCGYFHIDIDMNQDHGKGEVVFRRVSPYDVYVDCTSTDFLFRDASYMVIKKDLPKSQLLSMLPDYQTKIKGASGTNERLKGISKRDVDVSEIIYSEEMTMALTLDGSEDEIIDYYETYYKKPKKFVSVTTVQQPEGADLEEIKQGVGFQIQELQKELEVQYMEKKNEFEQLIKEQKMIPERAQFELEKFAKQIEQQIEQQRQMLLSQEIQANTTIEESVVTENEWKELQENDEFMALVQDATIFFEDRIHVIASLGSDVFLYEKILPISEYPIIPVCYIHTGTPYPLSAVSFLTGKQQELNKAHQILIHNASLGSSLRYKYVEGTIDEEYWEKYASAPGALLPYNPGFEPPSEIQPQQLNNAFFSLVQYGEREFEYLAGIYASMQGDVSTQHDTYKGVLANDEYGTRRIRAWMQNMVEPALAHVGKVFLRLAQSLYDGYKVFRLVQPEGEEVFELNVPIYDDFGNVIDKYNDYKTAKLDVKLVGGASMPINKWAYLQELYRWYEGGIIDDIEFISETDLPNKENLIQRKSTQAKLMQQVEGLQGEIKSLEGLNQTLRRQLLQSELRAKVAIADTEIQTEKTRIKEEDKADQEVTEKERDMAVKEVKLKAEVKQAKKAEKPKAKAK